MLFRISRISIRIRPPIGHRTSAGGGGMQDVRYKFFTNTLPNDDAREKAPYRIAGRNWLRERAGHCSANNLAT